MSRPDSIDVPPHWQILAPALPARDGAWPIRLHPSADFGDGQHPTTQLCLQAIAALRPHARPWRLLDFGSGTGILSIAGALLGATVDAVEIDPSAIANADANLRENAIAERVRQSTDLGAAAGTFDLVVANILRAVLLDFSVALTRLCGEQGTLVLSGLVSTDVPEVTARFAPLLRGERPEVYAREEWRALVWRCGSRSRAAAPRGQ